MAFDFKYLALIQQTQILDPTHNSSVGIVANPIPKRYTFNASATAANNSTAETQAANYFLAAYAFLSPGDTIYVYSNNPGYHEIAVVTSTSGGVTTAQIA